MKALAEVLAPAHPIRRGRHPRRPRVAFDWADDLPCLKGAAREFYSFGGKAPAVGQVFRAPGQAEVFRRIAKRVAPGSTRARWPRT